MNYYMTIASTRYGVQKVITSTYGSMTADSKSELYEKLFTTSFLKEVFEADYPDISYDDLHVLFCKVY